jgi:hypothetical protein
MKNIGNYLVFLDVLWYYTTGIENTHIVNS